PQNFTVVYHVTRNGQPFADVTETYRQDGGRYKLESITKGIGVYALFGLRRLTSEGEVTPEGLRPTRFEQQQGDDAKRLVTADFDWAAGTLTMSAKGKTKTATLLPGTQDLASYAYQFMFVPPQGDDVEIPVTTGKKLRTYHYRAEARDVAIDTPAGKYKTVHFVNATEGGDDKQLWLGKEVNHIPVRIIMQDDKGATLEQVLTSLRAE
ncbi:MAG TPA: DUF3108 domain-containing protein, partial [Methylophilaceae bacterium]|nr:DUF3108 domain-containing protein [Methylophilaceae bacterium]